MKIYSVSDLINQNFNVKFLNVLQSFWRSTKYFQCIGAPKKQNLFLFLNGCKIKYTDKFGNVLIAQSGDVVYTPLGGEYQAELFDFESENSHTIDVNFMLYDEDGDAVILSDNILIFHQTENSNVSALFRQFLNTDFEQNYIQNRIILFRIIQTLAEKNIVQKDKSLIEPALSCLASHIEENPSVKELAKMCNISEGYFRKQFNKCIKMSPVEYRNKLRLKRASAYLEYGAVSVQEISDMLGYSTVSHFIKEFKKYYGVPPLKYRKTFIN
ncbi:MAG: helix-turn-helix transcriptional regulator [Clostridia bacterium]|nr:helix-turn-helix transcriptional regulator [Clostridia bacterium]